MFESTLKFLILFLLGLSLTGCLNLGHLNYKQARMLKNQGFSLTDEGWALGLPEKLQFEFDHANIKHQQHIELTQLSKQLQQYQLIKLKIIGHTDSTGDAVYNQQLSKKRAQNVATVFIKSGFKTENIQILGRGSDQSLYKNNTKSYRALNRRVNIVIIP